MFAFHLTLAKDVVSCLKWIVYNNLPMVISHVSKRNIKKL